MRKGLKSIWRACSASEQWEHCVLLPFEHQTKRSNSISFLVCLHSVAHKLSYMARDHSSHCIDHWTRKEAGLRIAIRVRGQSWRYMTHPCNIALRIANNDKKCFWCVPFRCRMNRGYSSCRMPTGSGGREPVSWLWERSLNKWSNQQWDGYHSSPASEMEHGRNVTVLKVVLWLEGRRSPLSDGCG